jgi:hypothetical protein
MSTLSSLLCFSLLLGCVLGQGKLLIHVDDTTLADEAAANIVYVFLFISLLSSPLSTFI